MTNDVDYDVAMEIASHEAVIRQAYKDSVGVWTWSVGLTSKCGHDVSRYIGKPQTLQHCLGVYAWALSRYADDVREAFKGHTLTKAQFAGALSFHWNTGAIKTASWVRLWKAGDIKSARVAFMAWNKPAEIVKRRAKECALFFDGKWSNTGTMTEYTKLTANSTPVWSSAKKINVENELKAALGPALPPDVEPIEPKPASSPIPALVAALVAAVVALAAALGVDVKSLIP